MENRWIRISESLFSVYRDNSLTRRFHGDEKYLREAFFFTENLWNDNYEKIEEIKVVMIAEAPLFGEKKTYIYNPSTEPTAFFYFGDLKAFPSYGGETADNTEDKKRIMFRNFVKSGFIVLNIFPFAFNTSDTKLNYQKMNKSTYTRLLDITVNDYLIPKLEMCFKKSKGKISFVYRYKRLYEKTESHVEKILNSCFSDRKFTVDTVNGVNMTLDREKLSSLLK